MTDIKDIHKLGGIKARHIPSELTDDGWQPNSAHEEIVTLLEYFYHMSKENEGLGVITIHEGILFVRSDWTLGRDKLESFTVIK